jgi:ABC-2 type transport system ATP-binding protein
MDPDLYPVHATGVFVEGLTRGHFSQHVLQQLSLVAAPGQVYVLLGSASSGKSTLVQCVTGALLPERGRVLLAGLPPHEVGPRLGYMPQDVGLFTDLSVLENLVYFGRLNMMTPSEVEASFVRLKSQLDLAGAEELVGSLSRGAQAMVSFAAAIQHRPRILVLDEPNAGLDVLRNSRLWATLRRRAHDENCTVFVASHNVEDTRHADRVGFLRAGRLLAEGTAQELCEQYRCDRLEAVFTALCLQDDQSFLPIVRKMLPVRNAAQQGDEEFRHFEAVSSSSEDDVDEGGGGGAGKGKESGSDKNAPKDPWAVDGDGAVNGERVRSEELLPLLDAGASETFEERWSSAWRGWSHVPAVLWRQLHSLRRSWLMIIFQLAVPTLQALIFLVFVGNAPQMLNVAVVNQDTGYLGARLADYVNTTDLLETHFYNSTADAFATVAQQSGALAVFVIPVNFTVALTQLMSDPARFAANFSNVQLFLDYGDYQVTTVVESKLQDSIQQLLHDVFGNSMRLYDTKPIYGDVGTQFRRYVAAGYLAYTAFCFAMFVTMLTFFWERRHGCLTRGFAAGLRPGVVVASNMAIYAVLCAVQSAVMLIVTLSTFGLSVVGNYGLLMLVLWLVATSGLATGLFISALSPSEAIAIQACVALAFLFLSLGGIIWPLLSVGSNVSWISNMLPVTWAASAFRDIYTRGWGLSQPAVYLSIAVAITWSVICMVVIMAFVLRPAKRLCYTFRRRQLQM